jgi:hypothetical protein
MPNYEYYLNNEFTFREFIQDLATDTKIDLFSLPYPLRPKLIEVFFLDDTVMGTDSCFDYMTDDQAKQFKRMAFGLLSSEEQYKLINAIYAENEGYIYSLIEDIYSDVMSEINNEIREFNPHYLTEHEKYVQGVIHDGK